LAFQLELYVAFPQCGFKEETKRISWNKLQDWNIEVSLKES
jgi:hypothetical protein